MRDEIIEAEKRLHRLQCYVAIDAAVTEAEHYSACGKRYSMALALRRYFSIAGVTPAPVEEFIEKFESVYADVRAEQNA